MDSEKGYHALRRYFNGDKEFLRIAIGALNMKSTTATIVHAIGDAFSEARAAASGMPAEQGGRSNGLGTHNRLKAAIALLVRCEVSFSASQMETKLKNDIRKFINEA